MNVFTYWEGEMPFVNQVCVESVSNVYGDEHIHLSPANLHHFVCLPKWVWHHSSVAWRADYIRGQILYEHGGLWLDCDVILNRRLDSHLDMDRPKIWREGGLPINDDSRYGQEPELCIGILYSPRRHPWLTEVLRRFDAERLKHFDRPAWVAGQRIYRDVIYDQGGVDIGSEDHFNLVANATEWPRYWDGSVEYCQHPLGIHLLLGAHENGYLYSDGTITILPQRIRGLNSVVEVLDAFPKSVLADYLQHFWGSRELTNLHPSIGPV